MDSQNNTNTYMASSSALETTQTAPSEGMQGLHAEVIRQQETVRFEEDGVVASLELPSITPINDYLSTANDGLVNDIVGFLSRPIPLEGIVWKETDSVGAELINPSFAQPGNELPRTWIDIPMINQKLQGFTFLRCDFRVRVQFNAQPFNAGRVVLWFSPFTINMPHTNNQVTSTSHFGGITGYRHVDLDLSTSTAAELVIPYVGLVSHYNTITHRSLIGSFRCTVYSKLSSGASESQTSVDGTVWISAENIDLQMPTGLVMPAIRVVEGQMKKEKEQPAKGTIESIASTTSTIAAAVGRIPGLAEIANGVQWAADAVAGVAGMFGWSRPTDPSFATIVQPSLVRHMTNFNGDTKSKPLGLDARNEICVPYHAFATKDDEMALATILQKPVYVDRFTMDQTQISGTTIWRWPVVPSACTKKIAASPYEPGLIFFHTFASYLSRIFGFWRGALRYHFKVVKTNFHSGRIRVFFVPMAELGSDVTMIDFNKCYNQIFDIRDTAEFEFEVPYVSNTLWKKLDHSISTIVPSAVSYDRPTGMIYVQVLNQLRNPSIASNTIEFLVETSCGEDFQYAFLTESDVVKPMMISHEQFEGHITSSDSDRYVRRVSGQMQSFFESKKMKDYNPNILGMGEAITSLRQCLKRYGRYKAILPAVTAGNLNMIRPYDTNDNFQNFISVELDQSGPVDGLYNYVSYLYRMVSGSMRMMFVPAGTTLVDFPDVRLRPYTTDMHSITQTTFETVQPITDWPGIENSAPLVKYIPYIEGTLEIDVPFYQEIPVQMTAVGEPIAADPEVVGAEQPYNYGTEIGISNSMDCEVYRSIGEDFSFGYNIGAPLGYYPFPAP